MSDQFWLTKAQLKGIEPLGRSRGARMCPQLALSAWEIHVRSHVDERATADELCSM
jgi:hypothetical protein